MLKKVLPLLVPLVAFIGGAAGGDLFGGKSDGAPAAESAAGDAAAAEGHGEAKAEDGHGEAPAADDHAAPPADDHAAPAAPADAGHGAADSGGHGEGGGEISTFFKFPTQFFVPVVRNGTTSSVMIMTVTLDTAPGTYAAVASQEHRLRDSMLRSLIIHANTGGFDGNFTSDGNLGAMRAALLKAAQEVAGPDVIAVLIEDIARKEG